MPKRIEIPRLLCHKSKGKLKARVKIDGRYRYLGDWGTQQAQEDYGRLIAEWLASGKHLPPTRKDFIHVSEIVLAYLRFAPTYYVRSDGSEGREVEDIRRSVAPVNQLYGETLAREFGPLALKAVRQKMIELGWSRKLINQRIGRVKRMFKWGVANELVKADVYNALACVEGLRIGRTIAAEPEPVKPVDTETVRKTLPKLSAPIAAMVRLQGLTGMRPGEVCSLRPADVDRSGDVWVYSPPHHKTAHRGKSRPIFLGKRAQEVLAPFLLRAEDAYCFSPRDVRKRAYGRPTRERYTTQIYCNAIRRGARVAKVPHWHPNQLRHAAATEIRRRYGLEAAQVTLGHSQANVTQIYAERDFSLAERVAREVG